MESVIFREKKIHNIFFRSRVPFKFVKVDETKWKVSLFVSIIPEDIYFAPQGTLFNLKKNRRNQRESVIFRGKKRNNYLFFAPGNSFQLEKKMTKPNEKCHFSKKYNPHNIFYSPGLTFHLIKVDETKWKVSFFEKEKNPQYIFRSRDHFST